jgi:MFS family permease
MGRGQGGGGVTISTRATRTVREAWRDNPMWRRLYLARTASLIGNWLNTLAIVHLIGATTNVGALAYAAVFVIKQLPTVLLGPPAGVVADRFSRRTVMLACDVACALLALSFLGLSPGEDATWVYVLAALQIGVTTFFEPARQAATPDLVAPRDLVAANTLASATWSVTFAVGTMGGGVVLAFVGWRAAMVLDAVSYAISAALILGIRLPAVDEQVGRTSTDGDALGLDSLREAWLYLRAHPRVAHMLAAKGVWATFGAVSLFLTLLGIDERFAVGGSEDLGVATLWTARAVGTGVGPVLVRLYTGESLFRLRRSVTWGFVLTMAGYGLLPFADDPWTAVPLVVMAHLGGAIVWVMSTVVLQLTVDAHVRGRLFAAELALLMLMSSVTTVAWAAYMDLRGHTLGEAIWGSVALLIFAWLGWCAAGVRARRLEP